MPLPNMKPKRKEKRPSISFHALDGYNLCTLPATQDAQDQDYESERN